MIRQLIKDIALALIRVYQETISRALPSTCRYIPTCSEYTYQAIVHFGVFKGCWLGLKRIIRCNPLHEGGYDPVPEK